MDLSNCVYNNCSDDATEYGQGNVLSQYDFPNYGLDGCSPISQAYLQDIQILMVNILMVCG